MYEYRKGCIKTQMKKNLFIQKKIHKSARHKNDIKLTKYN